jgi:curli production assembly/transport component CsgE
MRYFISLLHICFAVALTAQISPNINRPAPYKFPALTKESVYIDSISAFQISIYAETPFPIGLEYHWQLRVLHTDSLRFTKTEKLKGVVILKTERTLLFRQNFPLGKENYSVFSYLLDRDFIIDQLVWSLDTENLPKATKEILPKPKPQVLAKLAPDGFDLGGLVFNETRTRSGREFYAIFSQYWKPPTQTEAYWITIREFPTQGRFTLISVSLNNRELFQRFLNPRRTEMENLVAFTIQSLQELLSQGAIEGLFSEQDLHGDQIETKEIEKF